MDAGRTFTPLGPAGLYQFGHRQMGDTDGEQP
jgi:hypothetical protein